MKETSVLNQESKETILNNWQNPTENHPNQMYQHAHCWNRRVPRYSLHPRLPQYLILVAPSDARPLLQRLRIWQYRFATSYAVFHIMMDLVGLLNSLGLYGLFLVGHDWGVVIAWYFWIFLKKNDAFLSSTLKCALRFWWKRTEACAS